MSTTPSHINGLYYITQAPTLDALQAKIKKITRALTPRKELKMKYSKVINEYGKEIDFDAAVNLMDDDIREQLHDELAPCTPQVFFDAYVSAHEKKFGEDWVLDNPNPVW